MTFSSTLTLAFAIINRRSFPCTDPNHPLRKISPQKCVLHFEDVFSEARVPDLTVLPRPRIFASHMPYSLLPDNVKDEEFGLRIVYVCRNPKDVLVLLGAESRPHAAEALLPDMGSWVYDPIWEHQMEYQRESLRRPDKVLFLRYEEMLENPQESVRKLARFLGQPFTMKEEKDGVIDEVVKLCSFEFLKELEVNKEGIHAEWKNIFCTKNSSFFRKGTAGDWKEHLTPEMAKRIDQITEEKLIQLID